MGAMKRVRLLVLSVVAMLVLTVTPAEAAMSTFWAGTIYQHHNAGGTLKQIIFTNYGACDSAGYSVNLVGGSNWVWSISSFYATGNNGCNKVKLRRANTNTWYYWTAASTSPIVNLGPELNDNTAQIVFYRG